MPMPMKRLFPIRAIGGGLCLMERDRFVIALEATPVGFALKSERERQALMAGFTRFLNSLTFPIQILVHTDVLRLDDYLADMKAREDVLEPHLRPALGDYLRFLESSVHLEHLLRQRFFLVLSWHGTDSRSRPLKRGEILWDEAEQELARRQAAVAEGLRPLGVGLRRLATDDLYRFVFASLAGRELPKGVVWSWDPAPVPAL
ncbi:MAG: TraC family protein [Actinomycetia bacterium]|nr:TraC family protein [Actinomycetes bacterium]